MKYRLIAEHKLFLILLAIASIVLVRTPVFADGPDLRDIVRVMVDKEKVANPNELDEGLKERLTTGGAFVGEEGQLKGYSVKRASPAALEPIDLCGDSLGDLTDEKTCTKELPIASFVLAQNTICYSCTLGDGTAVKCHSSSTYYRKYPCSSTDTSSTHHRGTCPSPDACQ
ncbi:MAG: hypothetical protein ACREA0_01210 [bacterium]